MKKLSFTSLSKTTDNFLALVFRSIAIFIILFQLRLIAGDLADTSIFVTTLLVGFAAAAFLSVFRLTDNKPVSPAAALVSITLIPWVCRTFIAFPRIFISGSTGTLAIILDSLLLNLDRNNFVSLFPYYWISVTTWFSITGRTEKFLRAFIIADAALLLFIFSVTHTSKIEIYRWPVVMIVVFALVVFLQTLALLFSTPPGTKIKIKDICFAIIVFFIIITAGGFYFLEPLQRQAVEKGGGLLEPKLFSFDFSKYLKLDSEISMKNDLILIVKKDYDNNVFLRRSVLSGYDRRQGFFQIDDFDEKNHPHRLPGRQVRYSLPETEAGYYSYQEYFLVNIDGSAFIGMKEPAVIIPYENWDASSFKSSYAVDSLVSSADFMDIFNSIEGDEYLNPELLGLSENEYRIYTEYGNDPHLRSLADEITNGYEHHAAKVAAIYNYLKFGEYRYSLKPGIAPDGDQLGWFLFRTKKGYCTYYAFAMTLLLRSVGIPARVAAGFFVDPQTNTFDYYPVRSDMAHAWVEVLFPGFGWIEFDPTTENLAEGEDFQFAPGTDPVLFERLMREIFDNRSSIRVKEETDREVLIFNFGNIVNNTIKMLKKNWLPLTIFFLVFIFLYIRCCIYFSVFITRSLRKKTIRLFKHSCRLLHLAGLHRSSLLAESEWTLRLDNKFTGIYSMYQSAAAARFAFEFNIEDYEKQKLNYKNFCISYNRNVTLLRRITGWIFPPLAYVQKPGKQTGKILLLIVFLAVKASSGTIAQDYNQEIFLSADELFRNASDADFSENWERAIELYREGNRRFPHDERFPWALGNLYFNNSLYSLAWDEFRKAEVIDRYDPAILLRLARTAGLLNHDSLSAEYYERTLEIDPDNKEAIGSLGWMYFKIHRLADGEKLLVSALERFGDDADFAMTLGTVYSDMYRYDDSKYWYKKAINLADSYGERVFSAIAWYNLSIIELRFYNYALSLEAANTSLNRQDRSSGRLARGEIYKHRLELEKTQMEFEAAYETDVSPLAKINLAHIYQVSGRLTEARLYAEDCLKSGDNSWMMYYGIDPVRYKRDIHEILANTYKGLVKTERFLPRDKLWDKIISLLRTITYKFKYEVNLRLYRKYSLAAASAYTGKIFGEGGPHLDSYIQYYNAFYGYPRRAVNYLREAALFETNLIPASIPNYDFEEGALFGDQLLIEKALYGFDPIWEKESISNCYRELANLKNKGFRWNSRNSKMRNAAAEELFVLNRAALRQAGIKLPVQIIFNFNEETKHSKKHLEKAVQAAGFKKFASDARFTLNIKIDGTQTDGYTASCELVDSFGETDTLLSLYPLRDLSRTSLYDFIKITGNTFFIRSGI